MATIDDFLEMFKNGELDVVKYFNDYETWFSILNNRGLMDEVDPHNSSDSEEWQNEYLLWLSNNDKPLYYKWIDKLLEDIEMDTNLNKIYWVGDRQDLSELFCDSHRYDLSQDTIRSILSDDGDWFEYYHDTTDDIYRDVIEELDTQNLEHLKNRIVKELTGKKLSPETEEMELIASEQGHDDYLEINSENVARIIDDEESMNSLLEDELTDLNSDLYSVHSSAYNSAYEHDIYDSIWKELNTYFDGPGEWFTKPHPSKKDTTIYKYKVPINDFEGILNDWLYNNKGYRNSTIEYFGSFLELLKEDKDCLVARVSDYPDFRKVDKNINSYFREYI